MEADGCVEGKGFVCLFFLNLRHFRQGSLACIQTLKRSLENTHELIKNLRIDPFLDSRREKKSSSVYEDNYSQNILWVQADANSSLRVCTWKIENH